MSSYAPTGLVFASTVYPDGLRRGLSSYAATRLRIHVDCFELRVELDGGGAHFAVAAGGEFEAAEGGLELEACGGVVDVDDAGFETAGELEGAGEIACGEAGGEAEFDGVGDFHGVVKVFGFDDGED